MWTVDLTVGLKDYWQQWSSEAQRKKIYQGFDTQDKTQKEQFILFVYFYNKKNIKHHQIDIQKKFKLDVCDFSFVLMRIKS